MSNPTIVFVCTGNTCRSPMAAALAASIFQENNLAVNVLSAGVAADTGSPASKNAVKVMGDEGIDLQPHRSTQISREILQNASLVLTMTAGHLYSINNICPRAKVFTLGEYAGKSCDVSDPYGGNLETYRQCAAQIKQLIVQSITKLKEDLWKA
ncbi:MAG: low molecular weight protein arginine phosphatase [Firmicutes bacterium]|nr:low molecular weight protein arginine phosphatase [Bacillota bacterium]